MGLLILFFQEKTGAIAYTENDLEKKKEAKITGHFSSLFLFRTHKPFEKAQCSPPFPFCETRSSPF